MAGAMKLEEVVEFAMNPQCVGGVSVSLRGGVRDALHGRN